jgi:hypothetical protein
MSVPFASVLKASLDNGSFAISQLTRGAHALVI